MRAAPGREDDLRQALIALVEPTSREEGSVDYVLHESIEEPGLFVFYENWESAERLGAHLEAPHLQDFVAKMGDLLDEDGLVSNRLRRIA